MSVRHSVFHSVALRSCANTTQVRTSLCNIHCKIAPGFKFLFSKINSGIRKGSMSGSNRLFVYVHFICNRPIFTTSVQNIKQKISICFRHSPVSFSLESLSQSLAGLALGPKSASAERKQSTVILISKERIKWESRKAPYLSNGARLLVITNGKSCTFFRLISKSVTLHDRCGATETIHVT